MNQKIIKFAYYEQIPGLCWNINVDFVSHRKKITGARSNKSSATR